MKMPVEKRLHELGNGIFAYTQLPGSWGWSNAHTLYREFSGDTEPADVLALFAGMARLQARKAEAL
ncbi:MAG: hypothetical protein JRF48_03675 [Deltaproteobacteria bacterium]|nr:hypothetical protein [Deltaproteobacteria bacterium]